MDDLTAVREWAADTPPLTDEARAAARTRLRRAIAQERRGTRPFGPHRRLVLRAALAGTAAAATAGVVVATRDHEGADAPRIATLGAAQVLRKAADRSRTHGTRLPVPRDDQYFYTKTSIARTYDKGGRRRTWTDESWLSVDGSKPSRRQEHGKVHHDPPLGKHEVQWPPTVYSKLAAMPRDPDKLLHMFRLGARSSPETDFQAFTEACLFLQGPRVMPPGLQAATFEALAEIPRVGVDHDEVDVLGRRAVGVSYPECDFTFLFDRRTYDYLGLRVKGSTAEFAHGRWRQSGWYHETRCVRQVGVVDRIGRRP
ncbi:CU044_5270 family protein [Streptomyces sp. NPDC054834]